MNYMPTDTWERCPIKSRVTNEGDLILVKFDENCPDVLSFFGLTMEISNDGKFPKVTDDFKWPASVSMAERKKLIEREVTTREITQRVVVVEKGSPCYTCIRGNTQAVAEQENLSRRSTRRSLESRMRNSERAANPKRRRGRK